MLWHCVAVSCVAMTYLTNARFVILILIEAGPRLHRYREALRAWGRIGKAAGHRGSGVSPLIELLPM
jgi:hypothetical protein